MIQKPLPAYLASFRAMIAATARDAGHVVSFPAADRIAGPEGFLDAFPSNIDITEVADFLASEIDEMVKTLLDQCIAEFSPGEYVSWPSKYAQAQEWIASNGAAPSAWFAGEAQVRGISLAEMAAKVVSAGDEFIERQAWILGTAGRIKDAVRARAAAGDWAGLAALDWVAELRGGLQT